MVGRPLARQVGLKADLHSKLNRSGSIAMPDTRLPGNKIARCCKPFLEQETGGTVLLHAIILHSPSFAASCQSRTQPMGVGMMTRMWPEVLFMFIAILIISLKPWPHCPDIPSPIVFPGGRGLSQKRHNGSLPISNIYAHTMTWRTCYREGESGPEWVFRRAAIWRGLCPTSRRTRG